MAIDSFVISIFLILVCGRLLGEFAAKLGSPAVVGEIIAGLLIGPSVFGWISPHNTLSVLAELGVILLLFDIGCDTSVKRLYHAKGHSLWVALSGILFPAVIASAAAAYWLNLSKFTALFFGCALTATSIGISIRVMSQAKQTHTHAGQIILGAAVIDDVAGVVLLSILLNFNESGSLNFLSIVLLTLKVIIFLLIAPPLARTLIYIARGLQSRFKQPGYDVFIIVSLICLFAWLAHLFGAPALLGGFAVGIALSRQFVSPINRYLQNPFAFTHRLEKSTKPLIDVFAPIFFVYVGITVDLSQLDVSGTGLLLLAWLALIAILTKLAAGFSAQGTWRKKLTIGCAMVPRGEVGLVFAEMGRQASIIPPKLFTELVMIIVITTIAGPLMLKGSLKEQKPAKQ